jgi:hypothetical protein
MDCATWTKKELGEAGERYAMAELKTNCRIVDKGLYCRFTPRNTANVDIVILDKADRLICELQ